MHASLLCFSSFLQIISKFKSDKKVLLKIKIISLTMNTKQLGYDKAKVGNKKILQNLFYYSVICIVIEKIIVNLNYIEFVSHKVGSYNIVNLVYKIDAAALFVYRRHVESVIIVVVILIKTNCFNKIRKAVLLVNKKIKK